MRTLILGLLLAPLAVAEEGTVVRGELGAALDRAVQRSTGGGFWGAVLVARGDEVLLAKGYGSSDYATRPNTPRTLFEIASTSKPFTAAAVLKLVMQRKLALDDPIARHLEGVPEDKRGITVHHLLTHTSGISPRAGLPYASRHTRRQFLDHVLAASMVAEPGEKFAYFNSGYALLAALVEEVAGESFERFSKRHLFKPARMKDTGFIRDESLDATRASTGLSERTPDATAVDWHWGWGYRGMGGVVSTVLDLWRWDRALRSDTVLDAKTKAVSCEPRLDGYACGWKVATTSRGTTRVAHSGGVEGYGCNYVRYLEDDAVLVLLSNGKTNVHSLTKTLEDLLFPPPRITVSIDVEPYELSRHKAAEFDGTALWRVARVERGVHLSLVNRKSEHVVVTIRLPAGPARKLRTDLERMLRGRRAGKGAKKMHAGAYLRPYNLDEGKLEITDSLQLNLMPRYVGRGEKGERIVDERITLFVADSRRRQWPVMAKLDVGSARALLEDLRKVLEH